MNQSTKQPNVSWDMAHIPISFTNSLSVPDVQCVTTTTHHQPSVVVILLRRLEQQRRELEQLQRNVELKQESKGRSQGEKEQTLDDTIRDEGETEPAKLEGKQNRNNQDPDVRKQGAQADDDRLMRELELLRRVINKPDTKNHGDRYATKPISSSGPAYPHNRHIPADQEIERKGLFESEYLFAPETVNLRSRNSHAFSDLPHTILYVDKVSTHVCSLEAACVGILS
ncbi:hypothetical protein ScPMuIL_005611 [Solemya velum]